MEFFIFLTKWPLNKDKKNEARWVIFIVCKIQYKYSLSCTMSLTEQAFRYQGGIINTIFNKLLVLFNREEGGIIMWYLQVCQVASAARILLTRPLKDEGDSECVTLLGVLQE